MEIKEIVQKFLGGEGTIGELSRKYKVPSKQIKTELESQGYIIKSGYRLQTIIGLKLGVEEYIANMPNSSISKICEKYHMTHKTLSDKLKALGYEIINHQNEVKFNENVFDSIDTEEKAYWLGFIFADGYISTKAYGFELSLCAADSEHLDKFNKFMGHCRNNVKFGEIHANNRTFKRCRWTIRNKHLWNTLYSYGCVPKKSLILKFPDINIFKFPDLIKHFIRGYWDGDGCISYANKKHSIMTTSVLGTENFLSELKLQLPLKFDYVLGYNDKPKNLITRVLSINGKNCLELLYYLYENSTIYLTRKFNKYRECCRLYEELYRGLQTKNGESIKADAVLNSETKESGSMQSIELEPEKSE